MLQVAVIKVGMLEVWSKPFTPQRERLVVGGGLPIVWHIAGVGFMVRMHLTFSDLFQYGYFHGHPVCRSLK